MWLDKRDEHEKCVCVYVYNRYLCIYIYFLLYTSINTCMYIYIDRLLLKQDGSYVNVVWQPSKMTSEMTKNLVNMKMATLW